MKSPIKRTINDLVTFLASITDIPLRELKLDSRRLLEADLLSKKGRGRSAAAATSADAICLLLAAGVTKTAEDVSAYADALSGLRFLFLVNNYTDTYPKDLPDKIERLCESSLNPVEVVAYVIDHWRKDGLSDGVRYSELTETRVRRSYDGLIVELEWTLDDSERLEACYSFPLDLRHARKLWPQLFTVKDPVAWREFVVSGRCMWEIAKFLGPLEDREEK